MATPFGIWLFAVKAHVDIKRICFRLGTSICDASIRRALESITASSRKILQESVQEYHRRGESGWCVVLDNIQEYVVVHEPGIGRESKLKCGTAGTAVKLTNCPPGAWDLDDHLSRVVKKDRLALTAESLYDDVNWAHLHSVNQLHWVRVLAQHVIVLQPLLADISTRFRSEPIALHKMPDGTSEIQPLSSNTEKEIETPGMIRTMADHRAQIGGNTDAAQKVIYWVRGDGGSHATVLRAKKYLATVGDNVESLRNVISTPELWHTKYTQLSAMASNHFGPATSSDSSSLSKSYNTLGLKRPPNLKSCSFYPTVRGMKLIWETQVLECWRSVLNSLISSMY
jgi:hypothetical protein